MMKRSRSMLFSIALIGAVFAFSADAWAVTVRDDFGVASNLNIVPKTNAETPQKSTGGIGNKWGGWAPATGLGNKILLNTQGDLRFTFNNSDANQSGNTPTSYAYTLFSSTGGDAASIDTTVGNLAAIAIKARTLAAGQSETIRFLVRDGSGQWLITNETFVLADTDTHTFPTSAMTWASVPAAAAADMDQMDAGGALDISTFSGTPTANLAGVGGGGVYIEDAVYDTATSFQVDAIEFQEPVGMYTSAKVPGSTAADSALMPAPTTPGNPTLGTLTITNVGQGDLHIANIVFVNGPDNAFATGVLPSLPATIGSGASTGFTVTFNPATIDDGECTGTVTITCDDMGVGGTAIVENVRSGVARDTAWTGTTGLWGDDTWSLGHPVLFCENAILDSPGDITNTGALYVDAGGGYKCANLKITDGVVLSLIHI